MNNIKPFVQCESLDVFNTLKIAINKDNNIYTINNGIQTFGTPDVKWEQIVFIEKENVIWCHGIFYGKIDLSNLITHEQFSTVETNALNSIQSGTLGTINGQSLEDGDITLDLSLTKIVTELPTENILDNKIYIVPTVKTNNETEFSEYVWSGGKWDQLGVYKTTLDLSGYLKTSDADKKYMPKSGSSSGSGSGASLSISQNGSFNNFGNNGQAFNAVRDFNNEPSNTKWQTAAGFKIDAASFGVKDNGTTAFSHKKYDTFNKDTGAYTGAKNTAVLVFSGRTGLLYAKNTGSTNDVTDDMYKRVGVIDSPDDAQRVYSSAQVDSIIQELQTQINTLKQQIEALS